MSTRTSTFLQKTVPTSFLALFDSIEILENAAEQWDGYISVAVHANDQQAHHLLNRVEKSPILNKRRNIFYHVVFQNRASCLFIFELLIFCSEELPCLTLKNVLIASNAIHSISYLYYLLVGASFVYSQQVYYLYAIKSYITS